MCLKKFTKLNKHKFANWFNDQTGYFALEKTSCNFVPTLGSLGSQKETLNYANSTHVQSLTQQLKLNLKLESTKRIQKQCRI